MLPPSPLAELLELVNWPHDTILICLTAGHRLPVGSDFCLPGTKKDCIQYFWKMMFVPVSQKWPRKGVRTWQVSSSRLANTGLGPVWHCMPYHDIKESLLVVPIIFCNIWLSMLGYWQKWIFYIILQFWKNVGISNILLIWLIMYVIGREADWELH